LDCERFGHRADATGEALRGRPCGCAEKTLAAAKNARASDGVNAKAGEFPDQLAAACAIGEDFGDAMAD